jgi:hypothetical protein
MIDRIEDRHPFTEFDVLEVRDYPEPLGRPCANAQIRTGPLCRSDASLEADENLALDVRRIGTDAPNTLRGTGIRNGLFGSRTVRRVGTRERRHERHK